MKDLTYSQVKSFKENLIEFNNDLIKKNRIKKDFGEKHKMKPVKHVKYLSDDFVYEDIRCLLNETNEIEIKSYEAKPDEVRSDEIDYIDITSYQPISNNIESNETESNEDYCIGNIKNEFNKLSNNLVEANTKDKMRMNIFNV